VVVGLYRPAQLKVSANAAQDPRQRAGYNPAVECRPITKATFEQVTTTGHSAYLTAHL
jgi:hypothetical protein